MNVQLIPVDSSNLEKVGYDPEAKKLIAGFKGGTLYEYSGVPLTVYGRLLAAESHGKFLNSEVKGVFDYQKIG